MQLIRGEIIDGALLRDPFTVKLLIDIGSENYVWIQIPVDSVEEGQKIVKQYKNPNLQLFTIQEYEKFKESQNQPLTPIGTYLERFSYIWDLNYEYVIKKIKIAQDLQDKELLKDDITEYAFKWTLVRQECEMYCLIGENVEPDDFKFLCKRRGFDNNMKKFIIYIMKHVGLGDQL